MLEIDGDNWAGEIGDIIRVRAQDDTYLARVHVAVIDDGEVVLEEGDAVQMDAMWWEYTAHVQTSNASDPRIVAIAQDLPGNSHELSWANN